MEYLSGVPFPFDAKRMPETPDEVKGTWVSSSLRRYENDSALTTLQKTLDMAVSFSRERDVPVFCGEFGVYMINSLPGDRVKWYRIVTDMLDKRKIARTSWDYYGGFGIFNTVTARNFNSDLNTGVVRAMKFAPPVQKPPPVKPLEEGFVIYDDFLARNFSVWYWGQDSEFNMYAVPAAAGEYAIRWGNVNQYEVFWISFDYNGDFSKLAVSGYCLEFKARIDEKANFDVRFVNPENASSVPWRRRYTINERILPPDGQWHTIRIPLKDMNEHGAWINAKQEWRVPEGKFSWKNVERLEFVAEDGPLQGKYIWLDEITITKP
jgi:endoglucanase